MLAGLYKKKFANIYLSLYDVLEINAEKRTVKVEPGCSMGQITGNLLHCQLLVIS